MHWEKWRAPRGHNFQNNPSMWLFKYAKEVTNFEQVQICYLIFKKDIFLCYSHTQCGPKVLKLFFLNQRHIPFIIQNKPQWHIHRLLCSCTVSKNLPKFPLFLTFFNSSVTASWISATSAKWSPFNFIFNLRNKK